MLPDFGFLQPLSLALTRSPLDNGGRSSSSSLSLDVESMLSSFVSTSLDDSSLFSSFSLCLSSISRRKASLFSHIISNALSIFLCFSFSASANCFSILRGGGTYKSSKLNSVPSSVLNICSLKEILCVLFSFAFACFLLR